MEKMTNKKALEFVLGLEEVAKNVEIKEKLEKMLEQVCKKNAGVDKDGQKVLSPTQKENVEIKELIVEMFRNEENPIQIKELMAKNEELAKFTPQKVSALIRQLVAENRVKRIEEKRVAKFIAVE